MSSAPPPTASLRAACASLPGYHGGYLRIDAASGRGQWTPIDDSVYRRFLGGSGLGTWLLLGERAAAVEPLSPAAPLAFVFSPLVGSPLTTSAKFAVLSKSPLTERLNDSLAGSHFALAGKRTGCDALVVVGRAERPSVLVVDDGDCRLEGADDLWGLECDAAQERLRQRYGGEFQFAVIGPAGERLIPFATLSHAGRHAGRGGSGAVLGSKRLKAVAVRGTRRCRWAQPEALAAAARDLSARSFGPATAKYRELGTAANLLLFNRLGTLPTRNFQQGSFDQAEQLSLEQLSAARDRVRASCAACTIGCEHLYAPAGGDAQRSGVRVEYENLFALGPLCGIGDPEVVLAASRRCDQLGLDTISVGGTIAFAMECVQRRVLDQPWLRFGDGAALLRAIELIPQRRGVGALLALGSRRMAMRLGGQCLDWAPQVKGLEIPGYEPRGLQTMALGFAVAARGADHNRSGAYEADFSAAVDRRAAGAEAAVLAVETEDRAALIDSLILCKFLRGVFTDLYAQAAELVNLVTGWDTTADELRRTAARIVAARKHFNILAGWQPHEDTLPARILRQPLADDPAARLTEERLAEMIRAYNLARGWTPEGWLPEATARELTA